MYGPEVGRITLTIVSAVGSTITTTSQIVPIQTTVVALKQESGVLVGINSSQPSETTEEVHLGSRSDVPRQ